MTPIEKIIVEDHAARGETPKPEARANACMPAVYRSVHSWNISHIGAKQRAKMEARGAIPTPISENSQPRSPKP